MAESLFTVVIPLFNKEEYIEKCVNSVLFQTYSDIEILVVDDGSTDASLQQLKSISDPRLTILQKENGGVSSARNTGIKNAKGKYIAFLDADDEYETNFLYEINKLINQHPGASAAASAYNIKRGTEITRSSTAKGVSANGGIVTDFFREWVAGAFFCASSVVISKDYFYKHDKWFPEGEPMGEDQEIWFHLAEHGSLAYIGKYLSNYNIGIENSLTKSNKLTDELPFISRLRAKTDNKPADQFKALFLQKYDLERAINNALAGNKKLALSLLGHYGLSLNFFKLKLLLIILLLSPATLINAARKLVRRYR